uniref:phosphatidylinositol 4,5-bisphosphate 3-kinase catalytic subunit gamma isoform-like isoform X1 n=1 Tax=Styela clava TaxID=7725 RepID=UPI00193A913C|nr:phosphatidylinositol 4,5-bisphosphate 3-kinase catalytic subunit gamma isoform-like isoform X1 [Styela clava]
MDKSKKDSDAWRKKSRVVRKASFERVPKGFFSVIRTLTVDFNLPNGRVMTLKCIGNHTVEQIKEQALTKMFDTYPGMEDGIEYILTYILDGHVIEICDLQQTFQTLRVVSMWSKSGMKGSLNLSPVRLETSQERMFNIKLGSLMGVIWGNFQSIANDELYMTRRKLTNVRRLAISGRMSLEYAMEPSLETCTLPPNIISKLEDERFMICIFGPNKNSTKVAVKLDDYPAAILKRFFASLAPALRTAFQIPEDATYSEYVMKVCGLNDYIWGNYRIIDFVYIRECLSRDVEPNLALCPPLMESEDAIPDDHDPWYLVDESTGVTEEHQQLTIINKNHNEIVALSLWDMTRKFQIKILGLDYLSIEDEIVEEPDEVYVEACLYHGQFQLAPPIKTDPIKFTESLRWFCWLKFDIQIRNIPKEARINVNVVGVYKTKSVKVKIGLKPTDNDGEQHLVLRWSNMQLLNHRSVLLTGNQVFCMWPMSQNEDISFETHTATSAPNEGGGNNTTVTKLHIELETYMHPVAFPRGAPSSITASEDTTAEKEPVHGSPEWGQLEEILKQDKLHDLDKKSKDLLFKYRLYCRNRPNTLPKLLISVNAANLESMCKMRNLLETWPAISVEVALELLDSQFVDEKIRAFATNTLKKLTNKKLLAYLLQLTQALKFEPYHDSALARFLLTRSLKSKRIGHYFFWFLRSEMENPHVSHRYSVLLEAYLRGCGKDMIIKLSDQAKAIGCLKTISLNVVSKLRHGLGGSKMAELLREELRNVGDFPDSFQAPYDPRITLGRLIVEKSKVMDSKKKPLWLEFENFDKNVIHEQDKTIRIMFKQGDDLRQDMLTLQMLQLMNQLWQEEGLDLYLLPYGCISTGLLHGLIQVVPNATTVASIQKEFGGLIRGSFKDEVLKKWMEDKNPTPSKMQEAVNIFMLSCAGYCVATYVLGIGDRHNDNIMVTTTGNLFHIDFGHFLGNTKRFYGIQRERVPFVLTPDFVHVMGTEQGAMFQKFKDSCVHAFLIIRRHAALFINLFHMMKATGIPELTSVRDIHYLRKVLILSQSEKEAREHFLNEISGVIKKSWTVQVNWFMHSIMHSGNS